MRRPPHDGQKPRPLQENLLQAGRCVHSFRLAKQAAASQLRQGHYVVVTTRLAPDPRKAVRQDSATQKCVDLAPTEMRHVAFVRG
tara:strand:- start:620 stop:874 length:255 start_codon:yes stop_codon:yes gene_type:complete